MLAVFLQAGRGEAQTGAFSHQGRRRASATPAKAADATIPALLVGDIHFDPFHDPAKVPQLIGAAESQWSTILAAPASPDQQQAFASLQRKCPTRGVDTSYALLQSALGAMRTKQPDAQFVTVSGDLIAHSFFCRYKAILPESTQSDYQAFVLKTLSFVTGVLRASFPAVPIYIALGNNDTPCDDYRLDAGSDFLSQVGKIITTGLPLSQQQQALQAFAEGGHYSLTMPAPVRDTRLLVINDLFMSTHYRTCAGTPDVTATTAELAWLREQLNQARQSGQKVWVMGHIPPGIDLYSTVTHLRDVCGTGAADMFLSSDALPDLLVEFGDAVRLGIFAHSHMDEIRLLEPSGGTPGHSVAIKVVPSISAIDGNNPSFTIARVNPSLAQLQNYEVIAASNQTGIATKWSKEYGYAQTYHAADFAPSSVKDLVTKFENDRSGKTGASEAYIHNFYVGRSSELELFWPEYLCLLRNHTAKAFAACACSSK